MIKPKIIFLGTPEFAIPVLNCLINSEFRPAAVITQPDKPAGRKLKLTSPPVKNLAEKYNLKVFQPRHKTELRQILDELKPDLCILVAFGMIIPDDLLNLPALGWLNIHPSLLPKYRGSSPIQAAILNNDSHTGISIIRLINRVDAGPILAQAKAAISSEDTAETLSRKLANLAANILIDNLPPYLDRTAGLKEQADADATYTGMIDRQQGEISWQKSAAEINRQFRAFYPWPGIYSYLDGKRLKIANLSVLEGNFGANLAPGELFFTPSNELAVKCGQDAVILNLLQLEGKAEMTGGQFARGQKNLTGKKLKK